MGYFIYILGLVAIVITAMPVVEYRYLGDEIFDFPRGKITVFSLVCFGAGYIIFKRINAI